MLPSSLRDRMWIVGEAVRMRPALTAAALVMILLSTALPLASIVATGFLVGAVPAAVRDGLHSPAGRRALEGLAFLAATLVAGRLVAPVRSTIAAALKLDVDARMEQRVMQAVSAPPGIAHLEDPATLDRISMAQGIGTAQHTPGDVAAALIEKAPLWLQGLGSAVIVARFHWWLAPVLLAAWLWATDTGRRELINTAAAAARTTRAVRRAGYLRDLALQPTVARELRIYGLGDWLIERFSSEWLRAMVPIWQERWQGNRALVVSALPAVLAQSFAYALVGWAGARGEVGLGDLALYLGAIGGIGMSLGTRSAADYGLAYGTAAVPALRRLEAAPAPRPASPAAPDTDKLTAALPPHLCNGIRLEGVRFHYPGREHEVLSDLNLFIPAGHSLAIVGANGAGKTTLIKLLCRLYDPTRGRIMTDCADLRTVDPRIWRSHVSAIFQDFVQYALPARDNIGFGAIEAAGDGDRVAEAARRAGADSLIEGLPRGWDTVLSRRFAGGVDLSGGQWQRIALARALFGAHAGADVLILDDPTANLDVRAEAELYDRFLDITAGLTTILISHRFSTVRRADRICVLERGRIVEEGMHEELVAAGGRSAHMFALQASCFVEDAAATPQTRVAGGGDA
ncbi:MAG: ABC transporter ATP-binding protein [Chloroflexi bacterium]|nr:ABC transporter ATP-binding protein [Chloroflexota bacterium]